MIFNAKTGTIYDFTSQKAVTVSSFMDKYMSALGNASSIPHTYVGGVLTSKDVLVDSILAYTVAYSYTTGILVQEVITSTAGDYVIISYIYNVDSTLSNILKVLTSVGIPNGALIDQNGFYILDSSGNYIITTEV